MAKKNRIPKYIAGVKVPKPLRKSKMLRAMMDNSGGRDVLAHALTAGAGAAMALLIGQHCGRGAAGCVLGRDAGRARLGPAVQTQAEPESFPSPARADALTAAAREPDDQEKGSGLETIERFLISKYHDKFASRLIVAASVDDDDQGDDDPTQLAPSIADVKTTANAPSGEDLPA